MNRDLYKSVGSILIILGIVFNLLVFFGSDKIDTAYLTLVIVSFYSILLGILFYRIKEDEQNILTNIALILVVVSFVVNIILTIYFGGHLLVFLFWVIPLSALAYIISLSLLLIDKFRKSSWNKLLLLFILIFIVILPLAPHYSDIKSEAVPLIATTLGKPTLCNLFEEEKSMERCLAQIERAKLNIILDEGNCDLAEDGDYCYLKLAKKQNDVTLCEKINKENENKDRCYSHFASIKSSVELCDKIVNEESRGSCISKLAIKKNDLALCEKITSNKPRDNCFLGIAIGKNDLTLCDKINVNDIRDRCFLGIARNLKDNTLCEKVVDDEKSESCACSFMVGADKDNCYYDLTKKFRKDYCRYTSVNKDNCIHDIAILLEDIKRCEWIFNLAKKDSCFNHFNK